MTVNEYITMDLLLPLAGGLAGAALYHLGAAFLHWAFVGYAAEKVATVRQLDENQGCVLAKITHDRTRLDALEERMGKVEEEQAPRTAMEAMVRNEKFYPSTITEALQRQCNWAQTYYNAALDRTAEPDTPYTPYGAAGKPCPKPTKDLRPGDEVSVKMQVVYGSKNTVKLILAHKDYANSGEAFVARGDLDSMRTDV